MTIAALDAKLQDFHRRNPGFTAPSLGARIAELQNVQEEDPQLLRGKLQSWVLRTQERITFAVACATPPETAFDAGPLRHIGGDLLDRKSVYQDVWDAFEDWADRNDLQVRLCTWTAPDQKIITTHVEITPIWSA